MTNHPSDTSPLNYQSGFLHFDGIDITGLAETYGTPLFIYSADTMLAKLGVLTGSLGISPDQVFYGVKANSNLTVLRKFLEAGTGFDIVSGGELQRVLMIGATPEQIVFSGVGKSDKELESAISLGIKSINIESFPEYQKIQHIAKRLGKVANISIRVNPDVDAGTHPYISTGLKQNKFGVSENQAFNILRLAGQDDNIKIVGLDCHIGSQMLDVSPLIEATEYMVNLCNKVSEMGISLHHLDIGGGIGVPYGQEEVVDFSELKAAIKRFSKKNKLQIIFEPGRFLVAEAGVLLTRVLGIKDNEEQHFTIVDAAMNDLLRPSLYSAFHNILPAKEAMIQAQAQTNIVGPICESGDFLGNSRSISSEEGELIAIENAGAYAFTMSSNYNSRPRAAEIIVASGEISIARKRETFYDLVRNEL